MIVLDFDGVLLNSLDDVVLTSWNAVSNETQESLETLPVEYVQLVRINRFHCQPAGDFISLGLALKNGLRPANGELFSKEEYQNILASSSTDLKARTSLFFQARSRLVAKNKTAWLELNSIYKPLWSIACKHPEKVVLLTNKNIASVISSTEHQGLRLNPENIYSGDNGVRKQENLLRIIERFEPTSIEFIDDSIKNLIELQEFALASSFPGGKAVRFIPYLASWGFVGPDDDKLAESKSIVVQSLEDFSTYYQNWLKQHN